MATAIFELFGNPGTSCNPFAADISDDCNMTIDFVVDIYFSFLLCQFKSVHTDQFYSLNNKKVIDHFIHTKEKCHQSKLKSMC